MKIFKIVAKEYPSDLEEKTQNVIRDLFSDYPNGEIEKINNWGDGNWVYTSILFETEPKKDEINPLFIHQIISELKGE